MEGLLKDIAELKKDNADLKAMVNTHDRKLLTRFTVKNAPVVVFNQQFPNGADVPSYTIVSSPFSLGKGVNQIALSFSHYVAGDGAVMTITLTLRTPAPTARPTRAPTTPGPTKAPTAVSPTKAPSRSSRIFTVSRTYVHNSVSAHLSQSFTFQTPPFTSNQVGVTAELSWTATGLFGMDAGDYLTMTAFAMV